MDEVLVAASVAVPLILALAWAIWWFVASARRERRRHAAAHYARRYHMAADVMAGYTPPALSLRGQGQAVTVAELLRQAAERGEGIRLNWPEDDLDEAGRVRLSLQDQFPTAILPKPFDFDEEDE